MWIDKKPSTKKRQVLDIGCGNTPHEDATTILDIDGSIKPNFPKKTFIKHDANKVPFPLKEGSFEYIYLYHILEHLDVSDELIFKELYRLTCMYGKVEISLPNSLHFYHRLLYFLGIIPCDFILCHKKHYTFQQVKTNLRNAGFKIYEMDNKWLFNPFKNITNIHITIIAKKVG